MKFETLITITSDDERKKRARKWPVDPSDRSKLLTRRRGGYINFYDCGMIVDDSEPEGYRQIDLQHIPATITSPGSSEPAGYNAALRDIIFDEPVENWKNFYKRITPDMQTAGASWDFILWRTVPPGNTLEIIVRTPSNWTQSGLKLPGNFFQTGASTPGLRIGSSVVLWHEFGTWGAFQTKITETYDFAADEVDIEPSNSMDIFMIPMPVFIQSEARYFDSYVLPQPPSDPGEVSHTEQLNYFWQLMPREVLFDDHPIWFHVVNGTVEAGGLVTDIDFTLNDPSDAEVPIEYTPPRISSWQSFLDVARYMAELDSNRSKHTTSPGSTTTGDGGDYLASFDRNSYPNTYGAGGQVMASAEWRFLQKSEQSGTLKAVIRQGGQYYYVWAT